MQVEYDGSLEGFFSVLYQVFTRKIHDPKIYRKRDRTSSSQQDLFNLPTSDSFFVPSEKEIAHHVLSGIHKRYGRTVLNIMTRAFLSEIPSIENHLYDYIKRASRLGIKIVHDIAHPTVNLVDKASRRVQGEYHRYLGLIRFRELKDGVYYAPFQPDTNILPLMPPHFIDRFGSQPWVIHDTKRQTALFWDCRTINMVKLVEAPNLSASVLSKKEKEFSGLWKEYYKQIGVKDRKNLKLRLQFLPRKTWRFLTELQES